MDYLPKTQQFQLPEKAPGMSESGFFLAIPAELMSESTCVGDVNHSLAALTLYTELDTLNAVKIALDLPTGCLACLKRLRSSARVACVDLMERSNAVHRLSAHTGRCFFESHH